MIIFTTLRSIPDNYLEYKRIKHLMIYNLSSSYADNNIINLNALIPSIEYIPESVLTGDCADANFDIAYHQYIFNNELAFCQFMQMIVPVYMDPDILVQVLIEDSPYRNAIAESIAKLIQQRYGYNIYYVYNLEDFLYIEESDFTPQGLLALDADVDRYRSIEYYENGISEDEYAI